MQPDKIRVLIVDDSAFRREALTAILQTDHQIEVVGTAADGQQAVSKTLSLRPHVVTMDIQMPVMNGFEAIENIMREVPTPVIVTSGIEVETVVRALSVGAMDFVTLTRDIELIGAELIEKVKIASRVKPIRRMRYKKTEETITLPKPMTNTQKVIAVGASTGGPATLAQFLSCLPTNLPLGILVVQHMAKGFIGGLANHLQAFCNNMVGVAQQGQKLKNGMLLFAPDGHHMRLLYNRTIELIKDDRPSALYVPSIDTMMESVAQACGNNAVGVLMTGMGSDGVRGMKAIKECGGLTLAQNKETSAVFGMNGAAIQAGYVDVAGPPQRIAEEIISLCSVQTTLA